MVGGIYPGFGVPAYGAPVNPVLFGKNGASRGKLEQVIQDCAYCADSFKRGRQATYDHVKPDSAGGTNLPDNGILACQPCNNDRSNVPLLEFMQGYDGSYIYTSHGDNNKRTNLFVRSKRVIDKRQNAFSNYLKQFAEQNIKVDNQHWFSKALDNMIYPVWGEGKKPAVITDNMVTDRMKVLINVLSEADAKYWLSPRFENLVQNQFDLPSDKRSALVKAINAVRTDRSNVTNSNSVLDKITNGFNPFSQPRKIPQVAI